jgi:hypothetical protein
MFANARSSLIAALSLCLALAAPRANAAAGLPGCESGTLAGLWKNPVPGMPVPGKAHGKLFDEDGDVRYVLDALVLKEPGPPASAPGQHGRIVGVAVLQGGVAGPPSVQVRGRWRAVEPGQGVFHVVLFVPDASAEQGIRVIGKARGRFLDPTPGPGTAPGGFAGKWVACPGGLDPALSAGTPH